MARLFLILCLVTMNYILRNDSKHDMKTLYQPYGPKMCKMLCTDLHNTFVYSEENLSCRQLPDIVSSKMRPELTTNSFICMKTERMLTGNTTLALKSRLNSCQRGSKATTTARNSPHTSMKMLHKACTLGDLSTVRCIIFKKLADINCRGKSDRTPVMAAAIHGHVAVFDFLVKKGCNLSATDIYKDTVLHVACMGGNTTIVRTLIVKLKYDREIKGLYGYTPLLTAAQYGCRQVFDFLWHNGCNLTAVDRRQNNMLHLACMNGRVGMVTHILEKKLCDIETRGQKGRTPIMTAAEKGKIEVVDYLLRKGCSIKVVDDYRNNLLHVACLGGHFNTVKYIVSKKVINVESRGFEGRTPVMMAAKKNHTRIVEFLVSKGCNLTVSDDEGNNIFHHACKGGHVHLVNYFIKLGIVVAMEKNSTPCQTPMQVARAKGHGAVISLLKERIGKNGNSSSG